MSRPNTALFRALLAWASISTMAAATPVVSAPAGEAAKGLPPAAPDAPSATDGTFFDRVEVTWMAAPDATGYELYRCPTPDLASCPTGPLAQSKLDFPLGFGISAGDERFLRVDVLDGGFDPIAPPDAGDFSCPHPGASGADCQFALGTVGAGAIIVGLGASGTALAPDEIVRFDLGALVDAPEGRPTGLRVRLYEDPVAAVAGAGATLADETYALALASGRSYRDFAVEPGVVYHYRLVACGPEACSPPGPPDAGNAAVRPPLPPVDVRASDGTTRNSVVVSWSAVPGATSYEVYRCPSEDVDGCGDPIQRVHGTSCSDTGALDRVFHFYRVKACNVGGCSEFSDADSGFRVEEPTLPPIEVVASDGLFADRVALAWAPVAEATGYEVFRCTDLSGPSCGTAIGTTAATAFEDFDVPALTPFFYRITACVGPICSRFSTADRGFRTSRPREELAQLLLRDATTGDGFGYQLDRRTVVGERLLDLPTAPAREVLARDDFDGDGTLDLLLRHAATGGLTVHFLAASDGAVTDSLDLALDPAQAVRFRGTGDLDGDGFADILFRDERSGRWRALVSGAGGVEEIPGLTRNQAWVFQGLGDLDGDGFDDLLLRHRDRQVWYAYRFAAGLSSTGGFLPMTRNGDWRLVALGDLTGDGISDVLVRHVTRQRWHLYGFDATGAIGSSGGLPLSPNAAWGFRQLADLDGNGAADVLIRHADRGIWYAYLFGPGRTIVDQGRVGLPADLALTTVP